MDWIDVKQKLPSEYLQEVLCFLDTKEICLCCYNTISNMWTYNCTCNIHEDECECHNKWPENGRDIKHEVNVLYWMPLPNQPERLNPEDHIVEDNEMVYDSLNCMETCREKSEEVFPPEQSGHKSNRVIL